MIYPKNLLTKTFFSGLENHMLFGGSDVPEPEKTDVECYQCGAILEGRHYQSFTKHLFEDDESKTIRICEDCQDQAKWKTAEMPIIERDED